MKRSALDFVRCPACQSELELSGAREELGEVETGDLCCRGCHTLYPIVRYIPRFVPRDNYANSFGFQWNRFPRTQLDSYSNTTITRDRFLTQWGCDAGSFKGKRVLDVGCGSGRFAEVALSLGASVTAVDYSTAIDACRANLGPHQRLELVQGDIHSLPFKHEGFDLVYCFGVIMHNREPSRAFRGLVPHVRAGGMLAVDVYEKSWKTFTHPKYFLRPWTSRLSPATLFPLVEKTVPQLLRVSRAVGTVPAIGRLLKRAVPVANYDGMYPLNERQLEEWAILDTFDWLSPRFDQPQNRRDMKRCFEDGGFKSIEIIRPPGCHLTARGIRSPLA